MSDKKFQKGATAYVASIGFDSTGEVTVRPSEVKKAGTEAVQLATNLHAKQSLSIDTGITHRSQYHPDELGTTPGEALHILDAQLARDMSRLEEKSKELALARQQVAMQLAAMGK